MKKIVNTLRNGLANPFDHGPMLLNILQMLFAGFFKRLHASEMICEKLCHVLANVPDAQGIDEFGQGCTLAPLYGVKEVPR